VINGIGVAATQNPSRAAIDMVNVDSGYIRGNQIVNVGPAQDFLNLTTGIQCLGTFSRLEISENVVRRSEVSPNQPGNSRWFAVRVGTVTTPGFTVAGAKLAFFATEQKVFVFAGDRLTELSRGKEITGVRGNVLEGYGIAPVILLETNGALMLSTNRCLLTAAQVAVAEAQAGAINANDNYLEGTRGVPAMQLQLTRQNGPFTVLGNIISGQIFINGAALSEPWAAFNVLTS
jgi:hypothetical protein